MKELIREDEYWLHLNVNIWKWPTRQEMNLEIGHYATNET